MTGKNADDRLTGRQTDQKTDGQDDRQISKTAGRHTGRQNINRKEVLNMGADDRRQTG
jgi:hypothetical protein